MHAATFLLLRRTPSKSATACPTWSAVTTRCRCPGSCACRWVCLPPLQLACKNLADLVLVQQQGCERPQKLHQLRALQSSAPLAYRSNSISRSADFVLFPRPTCSHALLILSRFHRSLASACPTRSSCPSSSCGSVHNERWLSPARNACTTACICNPALLPAAGTQRCCCAVGCIRDAQQHMSFNKFASKLALERLHDTLIFAADRQGCGAARGHFPGQPAGRH